MKDNLHEISRVYRTQELAEITAAILVGEGYLAPFEANHLASRIATEWEQRCYEH